MLKIRLQGTMNDIKWFLKILKRDRRFITNTPSDPMEIKGTVRYKGVFTEIFREEDDFRRTRGLAGPKEKRRYYGTGTIYKEN